MNTEVLQCSVHRGVTVLSIISELGLGNEIHSVMMVLESDSSPISGLLPYALCDLPSRYTRKTETRRSDGNWHVKLQFALVCTIFMRV